MAIRLSTTLDKIRSVPNAENSRIIREFHEYMKANGTSENYQNQNLKAMIVFANFLASTNFFDVKSNQQIIAFLDTKIQNSNTDPDMRWITTWNDYLWRIKYFLRWLYRTLIDKFSEKLMESDVCIVIGFSLRDRRITQILHDYLTRGKKLILVSPNARRHFQESLGKISGEYGRNNCIFLEERITYDNTENLVTKIKHHL